MRSYHREIKGTPWLCSQERPLCHAPTRWLSIRLKAPDIQQDKALHSTSCSLIASQQLSNVIIGQSSVPNLDGPAWVFLIRISRFRRWGGKAQSAVNMW